MIRYLIPVLFVLSFLPASAQDGHPNRCDEPGDRPDVIVGDLPGVRNYGNVGDIYAYAVGTTSCNIGTCELNWISWTPEHPVIAQNMYKLKDGRLTQIGQSWLKHAFFALQEELCETGCIPTNGRTLGVNCSDPYFAGINGYQGDLGPRSEVNASTGEFTYPFGTIGQLGDTIYKRVQVHRDDLDPGLNPNALYFVEGQYVAPDDAAARNDHNNASWREVVVSPTHFIVSPVGSTERGSPAIDVWKTHYPDVVQQNVDVQFDGRIVMAGRTVELPAGGRRYEYAIQNLSSDRSVRRFEIPVPVEANVTNIGFHDIDYHSGEVWDSTDWNGYHDTATGKVVWQTSTFMQAPLANALRWGTMYNFWFDIDTTETIVGRASIDLFKPPAGPVIPDDYFAYLPAPEPCNFDGVCEAAETCVNCPTDCSADRPPCDDDIPDPPDRLVPGAVQVDWNGVAPTDRFSSQERRDSRVKRR